MAFTAGVDVEYAAPTTVDVLWRSVTVGVGASLVFVIVVVAALRVLVRRHRLETGGKPEAPVVPGH